MGVSERVKGDDVVRLRLVREGSELLELNVIFQFNATLSNQFALFDFNI